MLTTRPQPRASIPGHHPAVEQEHAGQVDVQVSRPRRGAASPTNGDCGEHPVRGDQHVDPADRPPASVTAAGLVRHVDAAVAPSSSADLLHGRRAIGQPAPSRPRPGSARRSRGRCRRRRPSPGARRPDSRVVVGTLTCSPPYRSGCSVAHGDGQGAVDRDGLPADVARRRARPGTRRPPRPPPAARRGRSGMSSPPAAEPLGPERVDRVPGLRCLDQPGDDRCWRGPPRGPNSTARLRTTAEHTGLGRRVVRVVPPTRTPRRRSRTPRRSRRPSPQVRARPAGGPHRPR